MTSKNSWGTILVLATSCWFVFCVLYHVALFYAPSRPDPRPIFERETGTRWPPNSEIIATGDNHSGFVSDGEFYVVLQVDDATIAKLIETPPAAPLSTWKTGPVPTEIGYHCAFGTSRVWATSANGGPTHYSGHPQLEALLSSDLILYSAHERCCDGALGWHNGTLLILDPSTNKLWLSVWDF